MVQQIIPDNRTDRQQGQGPLKDPLCSVQLRRQMGRGVAGGRDTVDHGSLLLTPGLHPRASPSASLPWAVSQSLPGGG